MRVTRFVLPVFAASAIIVAQGAIVFSGVPWTSAVGTAAQAQGPVAGPGGSGSPPEFEDGTSISSRLVLDGSAGTAHIATISAVRASMATATKPSGPAYSYPVTWGTPISGEFGQMSSDWPRGHAGLDFNGEQGDPVYAATDGKVTYATFNSGGYGNLIMIMRNDGTQTRYAHLSKMVVKRGDRVRAGDLIGKIGNTGASSGSHLHFEVRVGPALTPTNPAGLWTGRNPGVPAKPPAWACRNFGC